jgi:excisionase family DNA binding protein
MNFMAGELPPVLTKKDIMEYFQTSESTVSRWIRSGQLKSYKLGQQRRIRLVDLSEFESQLISESQ